MYTKNVAFICFVRLFTSNPSYACQEMHYLDDIMVHRGVKNDDYYLLSVIANTVFCALYCHCMN